MRGASPRQDENPLVQGSGQRRAPDRLGLGSAPQSAGAVLPLDNARNVRVVYDRCVTVELPMPTEFREIFLWLRTSGLRLLLIAAASILLVRLLSSLVDRILHLMANGSGATIS